MLPLSFYRQDDVLDISRRLIGKYLFTRLGPEVTGGMIIETEGYRGAEDRASHAYRNRRTARTETLFSPGGVAYVYLCYGLHYMLNIVTNQKDIPHAVLIRAIRPEVGIETMIKRRNQKNLAGGPGALCQALGITKEQDGASLIGDTIWIEDRGVMIPDIEASPRIGIDYAGEDRLKPWRFSIRKGLNCPNEAPDD